MVVFAFHPRLQVILGLTTRDHLTTNMATKNEDALILALYPPLPEMMVYKSPTHQSTDWSMGHDP